MSPTRRQYANPRLQAPQPRSASMSQPVGSRTAYLLLALVIVLWGSNWPIMKMGLAYIGPMTFSAARMVMAALCMFPLVAVLGRLHLSGYPAWLTWLLAHIYFLINFRNRLVVMIDWAWAYWTFDRHARIVLREGPR